MSSLTTNRFLHILTLVMVVQAVLFYSASRGEAAHNAPPLSAFPITVGNWHETQEGVMPKEELDVLKADDVLTRVYGGPTGEASLFVAYFKTQRTGQSPHSPKNCLPGSGWQQTESGRVDVDTPAGPIHINRYLVAKGQDQSLVYYWYQSQGRVIADEFAAKFYLIEDSIRKHRSDTSLIRVVVSVTPNHLDQAEKTGLAFVRTMYPEVKMFLPQ
ncbi:MAG TPA: EpsI family protein [Bryobacteraceae bacterium]|jgi:EpsI family protein|nr:EpsI family protein [Bryobacteraceae bacterium]